MPCCLGQRQLDKVHCPEAAALCSKARPFAPYCASSVQLRAARPAKGSPRQGQQRRPPPVAETGSRCWGSGQQDASNAQRMLGAATRPCLRSRLRGFPTQKEADSHLPLFPCTYRLALAVFFRMMSHEASGCAGYPTPSSGRSSGCADLRKPHRGTASQPQRASRGRRRRDGPAGSYRAPGPWRPSSGGRAYRHGSSRCSPCRPRGWWAAFSISQASHAASRTRSRCSFVALERSPLQA